jgi:hypothetical protein
MQAMHNTATVEARILNMLLLTWRIGRRGLDQPTR